MTDATGADATARLAEQVGELRDLFRRRLLEDKTKNQLVQSVQASLEARDALDRGDVFRDVFLEILLAIDRLATETPSPQLAASVRDELLEVMARRGLQPVPELQTLDARVHEVVGTAEAPDQRDGAAERILEVRRPGYTLAGRVLRPAQVVVAVPGAVAPHTDPAPGKDV